MSHGGRLTIKRATEFVILVALCVIEQFANAPIWLMVFVNFAWFVIVDVIFNPWVNEAKERNRK